MCRVALICEGPADRVTIAAILDHYLDDYEAIAVQPPTGLIGGDAGPFGGGWKGVRTWCESEVAQQGGFERVALLQNTDFIVIQVDSDVAFENEIDRGRPCPPPESTANEVRSLILQWLQVSTVPCQVVLCVPAMASETWAMVALFPRNEAALPCDTHPSDGVCVECRTDVKRVLLQEGRQLKPKLVVSKNGDLKNQSSGFKAVQSRISSNWQEVIEICSEARRFDADLRTAGLAE